MKKSYMDASLTAKERAQLLLEEMTIEEKMAQVVCVFGRSDAMDEMKTYFKHGIGQISLVPPKPDATIAEMAQRQRSMQRLVIETNRLHIPATFHTEGVCGSFVPGSTAFPTGVARGSGFDPELEEKLGRIVAKQETAYGYSQILAPVLDISRDSRMGRQGEAYGEDPTLAAALGTAFTKGIQETEVGGRHPESLAKHFLGFHNSAAGIHGAHMDSDDRVIYEIYGKPFQAAIREANLRGVMPCYDSVNGLPMHASKKYLTEVLRDNMGFDGVVASDYCGVENAFNVHRIGETMEEAGLRCLKAGMDVEMPLPVCYTEKMAELFKTGEADIAILDRAVLRVLEAKFRMGIFEHPYALDDEDLEKLLNQEEDEAVARQAAQQSLVLLKNNGALPLKGTEKKIAVIGPHAINARYYFGGYTRLSMQESQRAALRSLAGFGDGGKVAGVAMDRVPGTDVQIDETEDFNELLTMIYPDCKNLLEELKDRLPNAEIKHAVGYHKAGADESLFEEALELVRDADVVILTLGGKNGSGSIATMGEGVDGTNINLAACQDAFIRRAHAYGKPLIGVHFDGRPISSDTADELLDALIEAWNPALYTAEVVTDVLLGKENPSGKLPLTIARNAGQIPIYYNHPNGSAWNQAPSIGFTDYVDCLHTPRYHFGHGLSYTQFKYDALSVLKYEVLPFEPVTVDFTICNVGDVDGTEIVQLYLRDLRSSMTRPVKELQGFARVTLKAGEEKAVRFIVQPSQMAFLDEDMKWKIEKGEFEIQIGSSSADIRLTDYFAVTEDAWICGADRAFYADVEISE